MKTINFKNPLANTLNNQRTITTFRTLYLLLCEIDISAVYEFRDVHNFQGFTLDQIIETLTDIKILKPSK